MRKYLRLCDANASLKPKIADGAAHSLKIQSAQSNLKIAPIPDGWRDSGVNRDRSRRESGLPFNLMEYSELLSDD